MSTSSAETDGNCANKRRKTRKGTHSCWACKRRKEKCILIESSPLEAVSSCVGCQRRGTVCISQDFPEHHSAPTPQSDHMRQIDDRILRVEALTDDQRASEACQRLPLRYLSQDTPADTTLRFEPNADVYAGNDRANPLTPASKVECGPTPRQTYSGSFTTDARMESQSFHQKKGTSLGSTPSFSEGGYAFCSTADIRLAQALYETLPLQQDIEIIHRVSGSRFDVLDGSLTSSNKSLEQNGFRSPNDMPVDLSPDAHPVLIAKRLLQLAGLLQHFSYEEMQGLSEPAHAIKERLADAAIRSVTTQERLLHSVEGLECVMLESSYHANRGDLRLSWTAVRRAMALAQMMGFNRSAGHLQPLVLDTRTTASPQSMWFRIVLYDRYLCLMLGMPQGSLDRSMASEAVLQNETPLGRLERIQCAIASRVLERNETNLYDFALTQELDRDLQKATKCIPSMWWLPSDLIESAKDEQSLFWDVRKLSVQMLHYNLLNQLHVPYMLLSSTDSKYEYSKITCVTASREILLRFITLRRINRIACSCRIADFLALMAAMTLVLAHLDSHRRPSAADSLLSHLYLSDRAMMEQAQENMEEVSRLNADALSAQSADLLRRLLIIEAEAAEGHKTRAESVSVQTLADFKDAEEGHDGARLHIPYFGVIEVRLNMASSYVSDLERDKQQPAAAAAQQHSDTIRRSKSSMDLGQPTQASLFDPLLPGLTDRAEEWSFQGIDMAFFDNLMRASEMDSNLGGEDLTTDYPFSEISKNQMG